MDIHYFDNLQLGIGQESEPMYCPFCKAEHERKFSVRRIDNGYVYSCFRAKCGAKGFAPASGMAFVSETPTVENEDKPYPDAGYLTAVEQEDIYFFDRQWGVDIRDTRLYITKDDEYAFAILGPKGNRKGWHIRQPRWKGVTCHRKGAPGPKGKTWMDNHGDSKLAWFSNPVFDDTLILVEDLVSAAKLSKLRTSAALLGASLTKSAVLEIREAGIKNVWVWLDPDADTSSMNILVKHGLSLPNPRALFTDADPKDTSYQDIQELLEEYGI